MASAAEYFLDLGWQLNPGLMPAHPRYWAGSGAKAGSHVAADVVRVPAGVMGTHTAIVAQSGSGKSYFLGRLVEEIALKTRARCLILDPNADFRRIAEVGATPTAAYDPDTYSGCLPTESSSDQFRNVWGNVKIRVRSAHPSTWPSGGGPAMLESLKLDWCSVPPALLARSLPPMLRPEIYTCHVVVKWMADLCSLGQQGGRVSMPVVLEHAQTLLQGRAGLKEQLEQAFKPKKIAGNNPDMLKFLEAEIPRLIDNILGIPAVSTDVSDFYFRQAKWLQYEDLIGTYQLPDLAARPAEDWEHRIEVIDLASLPDVQNRLLTVGAILNSEMQRARNDLALAMHLQDPDNDLRAPTFIIVDEAHHLIPSQIESDDPASSAVREQFRTIASEGRKYLLFLIVVSQRPDKLDEIVLSECGNKAVMRLDSEEMIEICRAKLGLKAVSELDQCTAFRRGFGLLIGRWAGVNPKFFYSCARRTMEGGRDVKEANWACPAKAIRAEVDKL